MTSFARRNIYDVDAGFSSIGIQASRGQNALHDYATRPEQLDDAPADRGFAAANLAGNECDHWLGLCLVQIHELAFVEVAVQPSAFQQFLVLPAFDDAARLDYADHIRLADGA